jgi:hypothetical protein
MGTGKQTRTNGRRREYLFGLEKNVNLDPGRHSRPTV